MKVEYLGHFGSDLTIVNSARVSYDKWHDEFTDGDRKLIRYLVEHGHHSPLFHPQIQLRIEAPVYVARQLFRHQIGVAINEVSRRYVDDAPEIELPKHWRKRASKRQSKQGSGERFQGNDEDWIHFVALRSAERSIKDYEELLALGVAPEQARTILPMATITKWIWTGSLFFFARVCRERLAPDAQAETREVAEQIAAIIEPLFPVSWPGLLGNQSNQEA